MITCASCHKNHAYNTIFCDECGIYLLEDEAPGTRLLNTENFEALYTIGDSALLTSSTKFETLSLELKLSPRRIIKVPLDKNVYIGRKTAFQGKTPDIDLGGGGILAQSVSRRHAKISQRRNSVIIEDLNSVNGTYVNAERLTPYLPEVLNNSDLLQMGMVTMEVQILSSQKPVLS